jgi:homoserine/homoserine lactone efflux protein
VLQGVRVALSNPKTWIFFGAFFPQFIDPPRDQGLQIRIMGPTAMVSGGFLVGGGLWLAFSRSR